MNASMAAPLGFIFPDWNAPPKIRAVITTRLAPGVSSGPYARCNLGDHVDDAIEHVTRNRQLLRASLRLPAEPIWLKQVHGTTVCDVDSLPTLLDVPSPTLVADAARTTRPVTVLAVLTADCLPLLLCADDGSEIAAIHAGWRGLAAGVIEQTMARMRTPAERVLAWFGPAIGPEAFEVGAEVRGAFVTIDPQAARAFRAHGSARTDKWLCDIYALARLRLRALGVKRISGGNDCTASDSQHFFSYRRDRVTGRMASLIWIDVEA
jgi:polyphenol oxidase